MPKRRFQCMLSEKALARLEELAGAPNKRQVWFERFLTTPPDPSGNYLISEQGSVKSEPRLLLSGHTVTFGVPGKSKSEPERCAFVSEQSGRRCVREAGHNVAYIAHSFVPPPPSRVASQAPEVAGISPLSCPCGKRGLRVCECGPAPEVEEQAKPYCRACGEIGGQHAALCRKRDMLREPHAFVGTGDPLGAGLCVACEQAESAALHHAEFDPEAEQQAVEARKERKAARAGRKAATQKAVNAAIAFPKPTRGGK